MAQIGSTWGPDTWVALGGWAANTWGPAEPPVIDVTDVCLTATRTSLVYLSASTDHGRQCGDDPVACAALTQAVQLAPETDTSLGGYQTWTFTLPAAEVPEGFDGIANWTIQVGFSPTNNTTSGIVKPATVTVDGLKDVTDAEFTIAMNAENMAAFTFGSFWYWNAWRTDLGENEILAAGRLIGMNCVTIPT